MSIQTSIDELYAIFSSGANKPKPFLKNKVAAVFDHEPLRSGLVKPVSITITAGSISRETDSDVIDLRIYADVTKSSRWAQTTINEIVEIIENGIESQGQTFSIIPPTFECGDWNFDFSQEALCWVGILEVSRLRNDF